MCEVKGELYVAAGAVVDEVCCVCALCCALAINVSVQPTMTPQPTAFLDIDRSSSSHTVFRLLL